MDTLSNHRAPTSMYEDICLHCGPKRFDTASGLATSTSTSVLAALFSSAYIFIRDALSILMHPQYKNSRSIQKSNSNFARWPSSLTSQVSWASHQEHVKASLLHSLHLTRSAQCKTAFDWSAMNISASDMVSAVVRSLPKSGRQEESEFYIDVHDSMLSNLLGLEMRCPNSALSFAICPLHALSSLS